jgi:hypothetical protein
VELTFKALRLICLVLVEESEKRYGARVAGSTAKGEGDGVEKRDLWP